VTPARCLAPGGMIAGQSYSKKDPQFGKRIVGVSDPPKSKTKECFFQKRGTNHLSTNTLLGITFSNMCDQAHSLSFVHGQGVNSLCDGAPCPVVMGCVLVCVVLLWGVLRTWPCNVLMLPIRSLSSIVCAFVPPLRTCGASGGGMLSVKRYRLYNVLMMYAMVRVLLYTPSVCRSC
jgi:hypothetical protein